MQFVMKIIEIEFYSKRKLTQNQELSMKVIVLRRKAKKLRFHLNFLNYLKEETFKGSMFCGFMIFCPFRESLFRETFQN